MNEWTTTQPTAPGFYWQKDRDGDVSLVEIGRYSESKGCTVAWSCQLFERSIGDERCYGVSPDCEWIGPLEVPS